MTNISTDEPTSKPSDAKRGAAALTSALAAPMAQFAADCAQSVRLVPGRLGGADLVFEFPDGSELLVVLYIDVGDGEAVSFRRVST